MSLIVKILEQESETSREILFTVNVKVNYTSGDVWHKFTILCNTLK